MVAGLPLQCAPRGNLRLQISLVPGARHWCLQVCTGIPGSEMLSREKHKRRVQYEATREGHAERNRTVGRWTFHK